MKNNFLTYFVIFFTFLFCFVNKVNGQDLQFNASEIQSLEEGNKIIAYNGVEIVDPKGVTIKANNAEYNKLKSILKVKNNVAINDIVNNNTLFTNEAIYFINENKIISKDKTVIKIEENYTIDTSNVTYDRNLKEIFSTEKTLVQDGYNNLLKSNNFKLSINDQLLEAKTVNLIDKELNEYNFEIVKLSLETNEIAGKDLFIKFNDKSFRKGNEPRLKANAVIMDSENARFKKGVFTTCKKRKNNKCPPWTIYSQEVHHDKNKKIINYKNAWLKVYDKPVLYFPKFFHPDPTVKRQSGFLIPTLSSSNNLGNYLSVPYFYAISDNKDLTFTPRFYDKQKMIYQTEYREVNEKSEHVLDFSILNKSRIIKKNETKGTHFFSKSKFDTNLSFFENSEINLQLQQVSQDTYLKTNKLKSPLITSESSLNSKIMFEGNNKNLNFDITAEIYEDLSKDDSDRYEFIFPNYNFTKYFENSLQGELSFTSSGNNKLYNTNIFEKRVTNDLNYKSYKNITSHGFLTNYEIQLKNFNSHSENSASTKNELEQNLQSIIKYQIQYPLKKEGVRFDSVLSPIFSAMFSPNKSKNIKGNDRIIDYNNIFSLNRIGSGDTVEGGQSITIGNEFKTLDKSGEEVFLFNLATVFRDEENTDLPEKSTLNRKSSNIVGEMIFKPENFLDIEYNFSLDNDLQTLNYNLLNAKFNVNNFVTSFEFLEKNNILGNESYISNKTTIDLDNSNSLTFNTRRNKELDINEYYNLIYEYKNDCLKAAIEYKKDYYEDRDLKPEEQLFFSLTIIPFGTTNSPNLNK